MIIILQIMRIQKIAGDACVVGTEKYRYYDIYSTERCRIIIILLYYL